MADHPYIGLRPFLSDEFEIFFGRDEQLDALVEKLGQSKFLAILGASGCGKSSLVNVGFLSTLHAGFYHGFHWEIADFRPGNAPFAHLTEALQKNTPLYGKNLEELLRREGSLNNLLKKKLFPENHNLLILVDQFEELFRYNQKPGEIEAFITWLLQSCLHEKVFVAIAMRSEFADKCYQYRLLAEALNRGAFFIPNLNDEQLRQAIENPAKVFGGQVEPALVERLLKDLDDLKGKSENQDAKKRTATDQLPLMQHALVRLWPHGEKNVKLTLENYEKVGGIDALAQTAEEAFTQLTPEEQKIAEILLRNLTAYDEETREFVRNPLTVGEVGKLADVTWQAIVSIVEAFRQRRRRFLTPVLEQQDRLTADTQIDISHEAFIRQWKRLTKWANDEKGLAKFYWKLGGVALSWSKKKRELWYGVDLSNAIRWHENVRKVYPTDKQLKTWANRRSVKRLDDPDHFDKVMAFLKASQDAEEQQKKLADEKRLQELQREQDLQKNREILRKTRLFWSETVLFLVITIFTTLWGFWERNQALEAKQQIEQLEQVRTHDLFESQRTHAALSAKIEDYATAKSLLEKSRELDKDIPVEFRQARDLLANLTQLMSGTAEKTFENAGAPLYTLAVSANQQWLAAGGENGTLVLYDKRSGKIAKRLAGLTVHVRALVFYPNNQWLISGDDDGQVIQWSLTDDSQKILTKLENPIWTLALSPDGKWLAIGGKKPEITLWSLERNIVENTFKGHTDSIAALAFDKDSQQLASGSYDNTVRIWDISEGKLLHTLKDHTDRVQNVQFHSNGQYVVSGSNDKTIRLWDINSEKTLRIFNGHKNTVFGLDFVTPSLLASSSADKTVRLWDFDSGITVRVLQGHMAQVTGLVTQAEQLFTASNDGSVRVWSTARPQQHSIAVTDSATAVAIAPDGKSAMFGFSNGRLEWRALPNLESLWTDPAHQRDVQRLAFNGDGHLFASVSLDKTVKIWQIDGNAVKLLKTVDKHQDGVNSVAFSADNQFVITASYDKSIGIFAVTGDGAQIIPNAHDGVDVNSVVFDSSGQYLLSASDQDIRWWQFAQGQLKLLKTLPKEQGILWAALSPDNQWVARTGRNLPVSVYRLSDGKKLYDLSGHENSVWRAFFTPDSRQLITASSDNTVRFWDLTKPVGNELFTLSLPVPPKALFDFDFRCTPTGCWLAIPAKGRLTVYELGKLYR